MGNGTTRRHAIVGVVGAFSGLALGASAVGAKPNDGISHSGDAIHQEPTFTASPKRVYEALTDARQFTRVVQLSGALQAMHLPDTPAQISAEAGGTFALFGGFITGRNIELVPSVRLVQAWREGSWPAGLYSIVRFELVGLGSSGTRILFDHTGFPKGDAAALASGWKSHYWEPLAKVLA
jgi:uncharacterized protein YndB with AHSA1/START domain